MLTTIYDNGVIEQPDGPHSVFFHSAIPSARMKRFRSACDGRLKDSLELYVLDAHLSSHMYSLCRVLEVALREAVHRQMSIRFGVRWYDLEDGTFDDYFTKYVQDAHDEFARRRGWDRRKRGQVSPDDLIAELRMGAWKNLLGKGGYASGVAVKYADTLWSGDSGLSGAFKARAGMIDPPDFEQVSSLVQRFVAARNRISHCEPVVFGFPQSKKTKTGKSQRRTAAGLIYDMRLLYSFIHPELEDWILGQEAMNALLRDPLLSDVAVYLKNGEKVHLSGASYTP